MSEDLTFKPDELPADRSLVIVDDDKAFLQRLGRAMEQRGFEVRLGASVAEGIELMRQKPPAFAVVDLRLEDGSGLDVLAELEATGIRLDVPFLKKLSVDMAGRLAELEADIHELARAQ